MRWERDDGGLRPCIRVRSRMLHISSEVLPDRSGGRGMGRGKGKWNGEVHWFSVINMDSALSCWPCIPNLVRIRNVDNGIRLHPLGRQFRMPLRWGGGHPDVVPLLIGVRSGGGLRWGETPVHYLHLLLSSAEVQLAENTMTSSK